MEGIKVETTRTTTVTTSTSGSGSFINLSYFKTLPGILKLLEVLFGVLSVSLASDPYFAVTYFFLIVCWLALILTIVWIIIIAFRLNEKISLSISWIVLELWYTGVTLLLYFLVMILQFTKISNTWSAGNYVERHTAAAVFALFNTIAYGVGTILLFKQSRE